MDHSDEDISDLAIQSSLSEETPPPVPSFSETFRRDDLEHYHQVDLEQLRAFCLARNGLVSPEWRKLGWPKLVAAHLEIWKAAAKIPPLDNSNDTGVTGTPYLHHPSKDEIEYIKQVVASCEWESAGILKDDSIVMPDYNPERSPKQSPEESSPSPKVERRVSFHLPELAFSTKRQKDRKTLRKVLIHLKRTNPNFAITSATCSAVAMVLSIVQSSSISTLIVHQLVSFPWKYSREWPRSNNAWELDDRWHHLFALLAPDLLQHFESNGVDVLEGTIRYSWIPSWLSQNMPKKDLLARIWDVLIPSKPDAILYVCLSLISHFQDVFLSETDAIIIKSMLLELPAKLNSMEKVEAVLSQAMEWMTQQSSEEETEMIPSWVTAKVAPDDCGIVEYARHLRHTVIKGGASLIANDGGMGDEKEGSWFSLEGPNSRFTLALKANALAEKEYNATKSSSSKWSWALVLLILILAIAVIVGLETDCSVLLGSKLNSVQRSSNCIDQIKDRYGDDARIRISRLQLVGYKLRDEVLRVVSELKETTANAPSSSKDGAEVEPANISDVVMSPSENIDDDQAQEQLTKESTDEMPPQLDLEEQIVEPHLHVDESEPSESQVEETLTDYVEFEVPENVEEPYIEHDTLTDDVEFEVAENTEEPYIEDDTLEGPEGPIESSERVVERLVEESLHQTKAASKLAETLVSQFVEEAKAAVLGKPEEKTSQESPATRPKDGKEETISDAMEESNDMSTVNDPNDDPHTGDSNDRDDDTFIAESNIYDEHEAATKGNYPAEEIIVETNAHETKSMGMERDGEDVVASDEIPEAFNDGSHEALSDLIGEPVNVGGIAWEDEASDNLVNENDSIDQIDSDNVDSSVELEESVTEALGGNDDDSRGENDGHKILGDHQHTDNEEAKSHKQAVEEDPAHKSLNDFSVNEPDSSEKLVNTVVESSEPEPATTQTGGSGGPAMLEMARGFFSRYLEYSNPEHHDTIHLSTPFFSKDDVAAVFEELMAFSIDESPINDWDKKSKVRFNTWESTMLI